MSCADELERILKISKDRHLLEEQDEEYAIALSIEEDRRRCIAQERHFHSNIKHTLCLSPLEYAVVDSGQLVFQTFDKEEADQYKRENRGAYIYQEPRQKSPDPPEIPPEERRKVVRDARLRYFASR